VTLWVVITLAVDDFPAKPSFNPSQIPPVRIKTSRLLSTCQRAASQNAALLFPKLNSLCFHSLTNIQKIGEVLASFPWPPSYGTRNGFPSSIFFPLSRWPRKGEGLVFYPVAVLLPFHTHRADPACATPTAGFALPPAH